MGSDGVIDFLREYMSAEKYFSEVMAHDLVIDASHNHLIAEIVGWWHRELQPRTIVLLNGPTSNTPRCGMYNVVVGGQKWKELVVYGRTQFFDTQFGALMGEDIEPIREEDIAAVIPWATDTNFYTPLPEEELGDYYLWLSRPTAYKGLVWALEVAARRKLHLVVVPGLGIPAHRAEFEEHLPAIENARSRGARIDVVKLPMNSLHHAIKRGLYQKARGLLYPVLAHEPFGLVTVEAMACGVPVLATRMGAMPEIIRPGENGFLVKSIDEMTEAVGHLPSLDRQLVREDAIRRFHYTVAAAEYMKLAKQAPVTGNGKAPVDALSGRAMAVAQP